MSLRIMDFLQRSLVPVVLIAAIAATPIFGSDKSQTFKIPPVKIPLNIKTEQHHRSIASGSITMGAKDHGVNTLSVDLHGRSCGSATELYPPRRLPNSTKTSDAATAFESRMPELRPPSRRASRWCSYITSAGGCARSLGKQEVKRLIGGDALVQMKLTPSVGENDTDLRLAAELGLRSKQRDRWANCCVPEPCGARRRAKRFRLRFSPRCEKVWTWAQFFLPVLQDSVTIQDARFRDAGSGQLVVRPAGQVRITDEQAGEPLRKS